MSTFLRNAAAAVNGTAPASPAVEPQAPAYKLVDFQLDLLAAETPAQTRVMVDVAKVNEYAKEMGTEEGLASFMEARVHLFEDADGTVRISRGHTRIAAARQVGITHYPAYVYHGDARDAKVHALGDNARHGAKRNNADLLHEIDLVLMDPELAKWSNREIARRVRCGHTIVGERRHFWEEQGKIDAAAERVRTDKHGNVSTVNVAAISTANTARTQPHKPLDEGHTYSVIQRGLAQSGTSDVVSRFNWLRDMTALSTTRLLPVTCWMMRPSPASGSGPTMNWPSVSPRRRASLGYSPRRSLRHSPWISP